MQNVKIKNEDFFPIVESLLKQDGVRIPIKGTSMYPFLKNGRDEVFLERTVQPLKRGDIVLYQRKNERYVLHRIHKIDVNGFYMIGDNQAKIEGPILEENIIGIANSVYRNSKWITSKNFIWKFFSVVWPVLLPFRKLYLFFRKRLYRWRIYV